MRTRQTPSKKWHLAQRLRNVMKIQNGRQGGADRLDDQQHEPRMKRMMSSRVGVNRSMFWFLSFVEKENAEPWMVRLGVCLGFC
jgi:hypothetical protein